MIIQEWMKSNASECVHEIKIYPAVPVYCHTYGATLKRGRWGLLWDGSLLWE